MPVRPNLQIKTEAQRRSIELRMNAPAEIKTAERLRKRIANRKGVVAFIQKRDSWGLAITVHSHTDAVRVIGVHPNGAIAQRIAGVSFVDGSHVYDPQSSASTSARFHAATLANVATLRELGEYQLARDILSAAPSLRTQEQL